MGTVVRVMFYILIATSVMAPVWILGFREVGPPLPAFPLEAQSAFALANTSPKSGGSITSGSGLLVRAAILPISAFPCRSPCVTRDSLFPSVRDWVFYSESVSGLSGRHGDMTSNNTLERSSEHRGRAVLAMDCVLGGVEKRRCPAAQLGR
jgi:hypothetical protein